MERQDLKGHIKSRERGENETNYEMSRKVNQSRVGGMWGGGSMERPALLPAKSSNSELV